MTCSVDRPGTGVQAAARAKILSNALAQGAVRQPGHPRFIWFASINTKVPPLNNVHCRMAVEYAANKVNYQTAYGGPVAGGAIASTAAPPTVIGAQALRPVRGHHQAERRPRQGQAATRRRAASRTGSRPGSAYRSDRPKEVSAAQALQASLARVGIKTTLHGYPTANYYANFAGVPKYVHSHDLGIIVCGWAPDWPDGYGWFYYIVDGSGDQPGGQHQHRRAERPGGQQPARQVRRPPPTTQRGTPSPARSTCRS